jgi:hypothetical protein
MRPIRVIFRSILTSVHMAMVGVCILFIPGREAATPGTSGIKGVAHASPHPTVCFLLFLLFAMKTLPTLGAIGLEAMFLWGGHAVLAEGWSCGCGAVRLMVVGKWGQVE